MALGQREAEASRLVDERQRQLRRQANVLEAEDADADRRQAQRVARRDPLRSDRDGGRVAEALRGDEAPDRVHELERALEAELDALGGHVELASGARRERDPADGHLHRARELKREPRQLTATLECRLRAVQGRAQHRRQHELRARARLQEVELGRQVEPELRRPHMLRLDRRRDAERVVQRARRHRGHLHVQGPASQLLPKRGGVEPGQVG